MCIRDSSYRENNKTVGVVAVDPTSPFTGGAILGDRIRFQDRKNDPGFYARSMATRGTLGGLALSTADVALVLEASGKDVILIETVGVGPVSYTHLDVYKRQMHHRRRDFEQEFLALLRHCGVEYDARHVFG